MALPSGLAKLDKKVSKRPIPIDFSEEKAEKLLPVFEDTPSDIEALTPPRIKGLKVSPVRPGDKSPRTKLLLATPLAAPKEDSSTAAIPVSETKSLSLADIFYRPSYLRLQNTHLINLLIPAFAELIRGKYQLKTKDIERTIQCLSIACINSDGKLILYIASSGRSDVPVEVLETIKLILNTHQAEIQALYSVDAFHSLEIYFVQNTSEVYKLLVAQKAKDRSEVAHAWDCGEPKVILEWSKHHDLSQFIGLDAVGIVTTKPDSPDAHKLDVTLKGGEILQISIIPCLVDQCANCLDPNNLRVLEALVKDSKYLFSPISIKLFPEFLEKLHITPEHFLTETPEKQSELFNLRYVGYRGRYRGSEKSAATKRLLFAPGKEDHDPQLPKSVKTKLSDMKGSAKDICFWRKSHESHESHDSKEAKKHEDKKTVAPECEVEKKESDLNLTALNFDA